MGLYVQIWSVFFHFSYQFSEHSFAHIRQLSCISLILPLYANFSALPGTDFRSASGCQEEREGSRGCNLVSGPDSSLGHTPELSSCASAGFPCQQASFFQMLSLNFKLYFVHL